jgi:DUF1365 family protein
MGLTVWPKSGAALLAGSTYHARRGGPRNAFRYSVDYVLARVYPEPWQGGGLLGRNRLAFASIRDADHGRGDSDMAAWALAQARAMGAPEEALSELWLLTQPRTLGFLFNPVSFWFFKDAAGATRAVLAEVNNTFGDRHSYLCSLPDFAPIGPGDAIAAEKVFHVSPFQEVAGAYRFIFDIRADEIDIRIDHRRDGRHGVIATLAGELASVSRKGVLKALLRRPLGALRVFLLIHWQAIKLKLKGAPYRVRPLPPEEEVSR